MGEAAALISAFTWSCSSIALASLSGRTAPAVLSALRLAFGSFVLLAMLFVTGAAGELRDAGALVFLGLIGSGLLGYAAGDTLYIRALAKVGIQRAFPVVQALFIVLSVLGGIILLDESAGIGLAIGAALVGIGIYLVVTRTAVEVAGKPVEVAPGGVEAASAPPAVDPSMAEPAPRRDGWQKRILAGGYWMLPVVGLLWAAATILLAKSRGDLGAIAAGTLRTPAGAIGLLVFTGMFQRTALTVPFRSFNHIGAIAAAGIFGTALGSLLYVYAVIHAGAARTVVLNATAPLMAVPLAILFLGERFSQRIAVGTVLCVAGVIFVVA